MVWLFLIVLVDTIGFGIILPLLPVFAIKFSLNAFELGMLTASFAFAQFLTSPFLGALSDRFGRKIIIIVCLFAIGVSYLLLANATTFIVALLARTLAGVFTGNVSVVLASVADISNEKNRYKYMGCIGAASGLGFMLGPIMGGFLAGGSIENANLELVFNIAAIFTICAAILAMFFLKETLITHKVFNFHPITRIRRTFNLIIFNKKIMFLIVLSSLMWFSFASVNVFLSTWSILQFDLTPRTLGMIATCFAFFASIVQVISPAFIKGDKAIVAGFIISSISICGVIFEPNMIGLVVILIALATGIGILFPNLNSVISLYGSNTQRGFVIGLSQSAGTLGQTLGPLIVGLIYIQSTDFAWFTIALGFFVAAFISYKYVLGRDYFEERTQNVK